MDENLTVVNSVPSTKNEDCYFYYYSSCSKGNACPFRHEPAALRNETVCIYWRSGTCAKENCIFRHMEIVKKRDKIQCWWETQPGGCKKPHCSFQHQNILDHPREDDIKRNPDLILPVKNDDGTERNGSERQVMPLQRVLPPQRVHTPPITPTVVTPTPIIVPLFDGESDTESTGGSPQKKYVQQLSAQSEWELQKLRQIQADEANLIGYCFEDDSEVEEGEVEEMEEIVEEIEEDVYDAAHRRLSSTGIDSFLGDLRSQLKSKYPSQAKYDTSESDLRDRLLKNRSEKKTSNYNERNTSNYNERNTSNYNERNTSSYNEKIASNYTSSYNEKSASNYTSSYNEKSASNYKKEVPKSRLAGRLGKIASRAFEETFGMKDLKRLNNKTSRNVPVETVAERLCASPPKKRSLFERLGTRESKTREIKESHPDSEAFSRHSQKNRDINSRLMKENGSDNLNFSIRSLSDIKAEKERKTNKRHVTLSPNTKNESRYEPNRISVNSRIRENSSLEKGGSVAIKTLSQIRAEKQQVQMSSSEVKTNRKRAVSPISFNDDKNKKARNEMRNSSSTEVKPLQIGSKISLKSSISTEPKKVPTITDDAKPTLGVRKISIKKPEVKSAEVEAPKESIQNTSPPKKQSLPAKKQSLPAKKESLPAKKESLPAKKESSPAKKESSPAKKQSSPAKKQSSPAKKQSSPAKKQSPPAKKQSPKSKKQSPSKKTTPKANKSTKATKDKKSGSASKSAKASKVSRLDSVLDEEEALLLGGDLPDLDSDEEIDEDALLL